MKKGYRQGDYNSPLSEAISNDNRKENVTPIEEIMDDDQMNGIRSKIRQNMKRESPSQYTPIPSSQSHYPQSYQSQSSYTELPQYSGSYSGSFNDPYDINCRNIAEHVRSCPICNKYFDTDKTIYIIIILLLIILCVILLQKVLQF